MAGFKLRLLGQFRVLDSLGGEIRGLGRRNSALLAYLALHPSRPQSRDRIAALLWADRPTDQARHSLRQNLLALKKNLSEGSIIAAEGLQLDLAAVEVDVHDFERLARGTDRVSVEQAVGLYEGELLEGFSLDSEEFEAWLSSERARLRELAAESMERLVALQAEAGDLEAAIATAKRILALESTRETTHRALMRLFLRDGRRTAALKQYHACCELLRQELDAQPESETIRLFEEIRAMRADCASPMEAAGSAVAVEPVMASMRQVERSRRLRARRRAWVLALGLGGSALFAATTALIVLGAVFWRIPELAPAPFGKWVIGFKELAQVPGPPAIVVLPFRSLGGDSAEESFADGIGEGITMALSRVSEMLVISRETALVYKEKPIAAQDFARKLGARYVLDGSVQRQGDRLRVNLQLVDTDAGRQIWSERYDRPLADVFAVEDEITLEVITNVQVEVGEGEMERISLVHGTHNLEAWTLAGEGLKLLRRLTPEDNRKARRLYERAVALDPSYPGALDGLAWSYFLEARFGWSDSPENSIRQAAALAQKTYELDPQRARTYSLLGAIKLISGDVRGAVGLGEKSVELESNDAEAAALLAYTLTYSGEPERASALVERAMRLSPYYPDWYGWMLARANRLAGRYREAIAILTEPGREDSPPSLVPLVELAAAYSETGQIERARVVAAKILHLDPTFSVKAWTKLPPYLDSDTAADEVAALRRAGLPD